MRAFPWFPCTSIITLCTRAPVHLLLRFLKLLKSGTDPALYGGSLYFAYGGDVTLNQQRYEEVHSNPKYAGTAPWQRAAPSFFWNRALAQPLLGEHGHCGKSMQGLSRQGTTRYKP